MVVPLHMLSSPSEERERGKWLDLQCFLQNSCSTAHALYPQPTVLDKREYPTRISLFFPQESDLTYSVFTKFIFVPLHMLSIPSPECVEVLAHEQKYLASTCRKVTWMPILMFLDSLTKLFTCTHTVFMVLQGYLCVHVPRMRVEDRQAGWKVCSCALFFTSRGGPPACWTQLGQR